MHINDVDETKYTIFDENGEEWDKQSAIKEYKEKIADGYEYGEDFCFLLGKVDHLNSEFNLLNCIIQHIKYLDDRFGEFDPPGKYYSEINDLEQYLNKDGKQLLKKILKEECGLDIDLINQKINEKFFDSGKVRTFATDGVLDFDGIS